MKYLLLSCLYIFSSSLMSQSYVTTPELDENSYTDEERDPVEIDQREEEVVSSASSKTDCSQCETRQNQEAAPIYIMMPPQVTPAAPVAPAQIDYSRPQVGPDFYKQYQSGNYQFQGFPTN